MKIDFTRLNVLTVFTAFWQILQIIISLILLIGLHKKIERYTNEYTNVTVWRVDHSFRACWSLGPFIFVPDGQPENILRHESGHSMQSAALGPLYLFVVGIPSVILYWILRTQNKSKEWYHSHYPENWADKLGGVGK